MLRFVIFGALMALAAGQFSKPPGARTLAFPDALSCKHRQIHANYENKGYYFSWADKSTAGQETDWLSARNYCRQRCMDSVSLESSNENNLIKDRIVRDNVKYIWTSGRLCDFKGCDRPDLLPQRINGWFWTATLQKLAPTTERTENDWSENGGIGLPQPDDRERIQGGAPENCLALLNQFYQDGVNWHDVACHHKKPWVCEDSPSLLDYMRSKYPELRIP